MRANITTVRTFGEWQTVAAKMRASLSSWPSLSPAPNTRDPTPAAQSTRTESKNRVTGASSTARPLRMAIAITARVGVKKIRASPLI